MSAEIIYNDAQRLRKKKKISDLCNNIRQSSVFVISPRGEETDWDRKKYLNKQWPTFSKFVEKQESTNPRNCRSQME